MTSQASTIPSAQIRSLRTEAASAGDFVVTHACDILLGREEPVTTADQWEDRYGGGGHTDAERDDVMAIADEDAAMAIVRSTIESAAAMDDSDDE